MTDDEQNGSSPTCKHHSGIEARLDDHEERLNRMEDLAERIQKRPPVWATAVISVLTGLATAAVTVAAL